MSILFIFVSLKLSSVPMNVYWVKLYQTVFSIWKKERKYWLENDLQ